MFDHKEVCNFYVPPNGMVFDTFKKNFFPHLCMVAEDNQSDSEKAVKKMKGELKTNGDRQPAIVEKRIRKLDEMLKHKFSLNYSSVREAFLSLDGNFDGKITVEDMLKHFKPEDGIDYDDLKKLLTDKDSKHEGTINYSDFSRWLGGCIH